MKISYLLLASAVILFSGCFKKREESKLSSDRNPEIKIPSTALITGDPIDFYNNKMLVFPVGGMHYETAPADKSTRGNLKGSFFNVTSIGNAYYNADITSEYRVANENNDEVKNLIFYNKFTKEKYLLADSALSIIAFSVHKEFKEHLILFEIVKNDFNADSLKNSKDAVVLFISKTDGKGFVQLSPDNEKYLTYFFYPETNTLLIKSIIDTNNDKQFSDGEETRFTEIDLNNPQIGKDIFTNEFKKQLKTMATGN
jgi:hypothetical protein